MQAFPTLFNKTSNDLPESLDEKSMIDICLKRTKDLGIYSRCTFHEGYLDTLTKTDLFDLATSILVSHFIMDKIERTVFFSGIYSKLKNGAYMINADLAGDMSSLEYEKLLKVWINLHEYASMPVRVESFGTKVAMLDTKELASLIKTSGFDEPVLFFQTLFIHAWFSKVNNNNK